MPWFAWLFVVTTLLLLLMWWLDERAHQQKYCIHCGRPIYSEGGYWVDPEATGDDSMWRETCDANDLSIFAYHEPSNG